MQVIYNILTHLSIFLKERNYYLINLYKVVKTVLFKVIGMAVMRGVSRL